MAVEAKSNGMSGAISDTQLYREEYAKITGALGLRRFREMTKIHLNSFDTISTEGCTGSIMKGTKGDNSLYLVLCLVVKATSEHFTICYHRVKSTWQQSHGHPVFPIDQEFSQHMTTLSKLVKKTHATYQLAS